MSFKPYKYLQNDTAWEFICEVLETPIGNWPDDDSRSPAYLERKKIGERYFEIKHSFPELSFSQVSLMARREWLQNWLIERANETREPETQETFDDGFYTWDMDARQIAAKIDDTMGELRKAAGDFVRKLFMKHGYFNGRAEGFVDHEDEWINCRIVVSCYGLPSNGLVAERKCTGTDSPVTRE